MSNNGPKTLYPLSSIPSTPTARWGFAWNIDWGMVKKVYVRPNTIPKFQRKHLDQETITLLFLRFRTTTRSCLHLLMYAALTPLPVLIGSCCCARGLYPNSASAQAVACLSKGKNGSPWGSAFRTCHPQSWAGRVLPTCANGDLPACAFLDVSPLSIPFQ